VAARSVLLNLIGNDRTGRAFRSARQNVERLSASVERNNKTFKTFGKETSKALDAAEKALFGPIDKMFNAATAASAAAGGLSAVGAASTALAASVGPAAGALAVYPGILAAIKQGTLVAKLLESENRAAANIYIFGLQRRFQDAEAVTTEFGEGKGCPDHQLRVSVAQQRNQIGNGSRITNITEGIGSGSAYTNMFILQSINQGFDGAWITGLP